VDAAFSACLEPVLDRAGSQAPLPGDVAVIPDGVLVVAGARLNDAPVQRTAPVRALSATTLRR
jgi:hypothetical protein